MFFNVFYLQINVFNIYDINNRLKVCETLAWQGIIVTYAQFVSFANVGISQGSVATNLRCDGNFHTGFVVDFIFFKNQRL